MSTSGARPAGGGGVTPGGGPTERVDPDIITDRTTTERVPTERVTTERVTTERPPQRERLRPNERAPEPRRTDRGWTPAQWFCLLGGLALLLAGVFGFLADATFDTSGSVDTDQGGNANGQLQGDSFLGFEVNGWHNIVHLASGLLLLSAFRRRGPAKTIALVFGALYALVTLIGLIDGNDILGILPVNPADNILHIALTALGIGSSLISKGDDDRDRSRL